MGQKKQAYITGRFTRRSTESDYMGVLLDAVPLEEWREVVTASITAAKAGDHAARAWLAQYLVGRPGMNAPTPLAVVVDELSGRDARVDKLAKPHIDRAILPSLHRNDDLKEAIKSGVATELNESESKPTQK